MNLQNNVQQTLFHPSMFETTFKDTPVDERTLNNVRSQREKRLASTVSELTSPGRYKLTDNDDQLTGSNTRHLFKNLYGETPLTFLFFSDKNVDNMQKLIRFIVHKETGYVVDRQSNNELLVIMRSIFLEYSAHPPLIDDKMSEQQKGLLMKKYTAEVARLNEIVVNAVVPKVVSQMQQYLDYLRDATQQPFYMDTPQNPSTAGQREYRSVTQVLLGGDL